ncbi:GTP 3',8-cyclase MoaA [Lysobacter sp. TY2-98]|uniref:GTP 3',8-cyclase MoaA n=1 Tax=Lysobacter sp. TY2-98 TaxID=2290922 RepID=UPI000E20B58C|nr:GTP 3',8-cyclase MoaA [Lysobacter sp. TY2-98]AXK71493.1 GTP 3',8-cyclase MoaA [Lysobacter sp. TY2-98]
MSVLSDPFGRTFPYLRLSLTEACNFRCGYCLPDGYAADGHPVFLARDEVRRLVGGFASVGMRKVRLTGGEPTLRKDLVAIIGDIASVPGVSKIALTTNGTRLPSHVEAWRDAGLTSLNVSVDSLDREVFHAVTHHDRLPEILEGVDQALSLDYDAVKLNAVLLRGVNDDSLPQWLNYLRDRRASVRFIELMRTNDNVAYFERHHVRAETIERTLVESGWVRMMRASDAGPANEYVHPDYAGRIGIIAPYSRDFCAGCNRLRVTARGDLRLCLFGEFGVPLRPLLQRDEDRDALVDLIAGQLRLKAAGHGLHEGNSGITPHLASIGG